MLMQSAKAICTGYKIENITTLVKVVIPMKECSGKEQSDMHYAAYTYMWAAEVLVSSNFE